MKDWRKEALHSERAKLLLVVVVFLTICNYFLLSITLTIMLVSLIVIFLFSHFYHKYLVLSLKNTKRTIRVFPGETTKVSIEFGARSLVALYYGKLTFLVANNIKVESAKALMEKKEATEYLVNISSGQQKYDLTIQAERRGRAAFRQMEIQLFDPFFLGKSIFTYNPFYKTELLVFPTIKPVTGMESVISRELGNKPSVYSYHQDPILISGVRDYAPSDPFQQIHWKATARAGSLQTKILEKTFHQKWTFLVNISEEEEGGAYSYYFSKQLENRISHVAYLLQMAEKQAVAYEIYVNIIAKNNRRLVYLEEGSGKEHLLKGLELLARIDQMSAPVKIDRLIKVAEPSLRQSTSLILCGISNQQVMQTLSGSYLKHLPIYELHSTESGGSIQRC
ncbi:DUF58 domain-containing protein [Bacillus sp. AK128]